MQYYHRDKLLKLDSQGFVFIYSFIHPSIYSSLNSSIFSKHFILVRVMVDPGLSWDTGWHYQGIMYAHNH